MNNHSEANVAADTIIAGSVMTMPMWAVNLNEWLHLFLAIGGSILLIYRFARILRNPKAGE